MDVLAHSRAHRHRWSGVVLGGLPTVIVVALALGAPAQAAVDELALISRESGADGAAATGPSTLAGGVFWIAQLGAGNAVSRDGQHVAFISDADNLSSDDNDSIPNVFVRDVQTNTTRHVNVGEPLPGLVGGQAADAAISGDGRDVAFVTSAWHDPADTNVFVDVYVRDMQTDTHTLVSRPSGADSPALGGVNPSLSEDGNHIAFDSALFPESPSTSAVFVRDLQTNITTLVSRESGAGGATADGGSNDASISADGRYVAFSSDASNLSDDDGPVTDVFVRDLQAETTTLVSRQDGTEPDNGANGHSFRPSISGDGRYVAFDSVADNLGGPPQSVYVRDLQTNETLLVNRAADGGSADGPAWAPSISDPPSSDRRPRVAFYSFATNLVPGGTNGHTHIFVRDLQAETTTLVSRRATADGGAPAEDRSHWPAISGDGHYVAFDSEADNLSPITNDVTNIFRARVSFAPQLSIGDVAVTEGDSGTTDAVFEVSLSAPSAQPVTVDWETVDGTAVAGPPDPDYTASSSPPPVEFAPGETRKTVTVPVVGDVLEEPDETFTVELTNASGATIADGDGLGTIRDDDAPPALSIGDVAVTEGDAGTTEAVFEVSLSAPSTARVTVDYTTANGTATQPDDYTATSSPPPLEFAPGETRKPVTVPVVGDTLEEPDETFTVQLGNPTNASIADGEGLGTIRDDDSPTGCTQLDYGEDPTAGRIDPSGETDCFRFDGAAGELVRVRLLESSVGPFDPAFELLDPDGAPVPGCRAAIDFLVCELPKLGTYTILVEDSSGAGLNTGGYLISIQRLNPPLRCAEPKLEFGDDPTPGSILPSGETDCFRFDGVAGELVRVRLLENPGGPSDPSFELRDPNGDPVPDCPRASIDLLVCELPRPGTYTILVEDSSGAGLNTGGYLISIQRLNPPLLCAEPKLEFGDDPTPGSILPSGETDCFRFDGAAGELVRVRLLESQVGPLAPAFELLDPDGAPVPGCRAATGFLVCELPKPGTYTILVEDSSGAGLNTGGYLISIQRLNPPLRCAEPKLRPGDPPRPGRIDPPGETDCFRFDGAAGEPVRVRLLESQVGPLAPAFELRDPDGAPVPGCLGRVSLDDFTCTPAVSGPHTILVEDSSGAGLNTGDYSIQLGDGPPADQVPPAITLRTPPDGAEYPRGASVVADYECSDEAGGSGLASCVGTVPDGEPIDTATLGAKEFTVLARDNHGNQSSVTHRYAVIDDTAPTITLRTPPGGATYTLNQDVNAHYDCADESGGSGLASCDGTVPDGAPIDTAMLGVKDFTVTARDNAGNESRVTHQYRVTPRDFSAPRVEIRMPQAGAGYPRGAVVLADYECADEAGGSGLASCAGPVADGEPIDTATLGGKEFKVIARDNAGNQISVGVGYMVVDVTPPMIALRSPPDGAVYDVGQEVRADYECTDDSGGAGLASCAGPVADGDPIDTATAGAKSFTVIARDNAGNERSLTHRYTVSAPPRPLCDGVPATIVVPPDSGPVSGTPGADVIVASEGSDTISGRGGADRICGRGGTDQLAGDGGNDRLFGEDGDDRLSGGSGNDTLLGGGRDDRLSGGSGNDSLLGGGGIDQLSGGDGEDELRGGGGDDRLAGGNDDDELGGGDGDDWLSGDDGDDALSGGGGRDLLLGGAGSDLLFGGGGNDRLKGGDGRDRMQGERGDDQLSGGRSNDRLFGGAGDDDIDGGPGRDFCRGGPGADSETNCEI